VDQKAAGLAGLAGEEEGFSGRDDHSHQLLAISFQ
jgi:hypothetical protein